MSEKEIACKLVIQWNIFAQKESETSAVPRSSFQSNDRHETRAIEQPHRRIDSI